VDGHAAAQPEKGCPVVTVASHIDELAPPRAVQDEIERQVLEHLKSDFVSDAALDLRPETSLEGVVDSTGIMELVVWIEDTFGFMVEIDDITPDNFGSVQQLARWISRNIKPVGS
jgi:acyl carrier protein